MKTVRNLMRKVHFTNIMICYGNVTDIDAMQKIRPLTDHQPFFGTENGKKMHHNVVGQLM